MDVLGPLEGLAGELVTFEAALLNGTEGVADGSAAIAFFNSPLGAPQEVSLPDDGAGPDFKADDGIPPRVDLTGRSGGRSLFAVEGGLPGKDAGLPRRTGSRFEPAEGLSPARSPN